MLIPITRSLYKRIEANVRNFYAYNSFSTAISQVQSEPEYNIKDSDFNLQFNKLQTDLLDFDDQIQQKFLTTYHLLYEIRNNASNHEHINREHLQNWKDVVQIIYSQSRTWDRKDIINYITTDEYSNVVQLTICRLIEMLVKESYSVPMFNPNSSIAYCILKDKNNNAITQRNDILFSSLKNILRQNSHINIRNICPSIEINSANAQLDYTVQSFCLNMFKLLDGIYDMFNPCYDSRFFPIQDDIFHNIDIRKDILLALVAAPVVRTEMDKRAIRTQNNHFLHTNDKKIVDMFRACCILLSLHKWPLIIEEMISLQEKLIDIHGYDEDERREKRERKVEEIIKYCIQQFKLQLEHNHNIKFPMNTDNMLKSFKHYRKSKITTNGSN